MGEKNKTERLIMDEMIVDSVSAIILVLWLAVMRIVIRGGDSRR